MNKHDQTSDDGHVLYPEVSYDRYRKYRLEQRMNDVLWGAFMGFAVSSAIFMFFGNDVTGLLIN